MEETLSPEFILQARGVAFSFMQLTIAVDALQHDSLGNARYEQMMFQVEQMQTAFKEQVREFTKEWAPRSST